jgi:hypothetical protein
MTRRLETLHLVSILYGLAGQLDNRGCRRAAVELATVADRLQRRER